MVAVAGPAKLPTVIDRRRIVIADPAIPRPFQPFHMAREMEVAEAESFLKRISEDCERLATEALEQTIRRLRQDNFRVTACGITTGSGRLPGTLAEILASHPAVHTAEGELFRNTVIHACQHCGLTVYKVREKGALESAADKLSLSLGRLQSSLKEFGRGIGPPWGQDQKLATLVAWLALAAPKRAASSE
jgi:hypothetical protein